MEIKNKFEVNNKKGRVIQKINGFYYVELDDTGEVCECHLRGVIKRHENKTNCIAGDIVEISADNAIERVYERRNMLVRPLVANIDLVIIEFAAKNPDLDMTKLNILLLNASYHQISPIVVINKIDLLDDNERIELEAKLKFLVDINIPVLYTSLASESLEPRIEGLGEKHDLAKKEANDTILKLREMAKGKVVSTCGPSGAGKSTLINELVGVATMETGAVSDKIGRGRHTTKEIRLFPIDHDTYVIDTPGFSSVDIPPIPEPEMLADYFPEFACHEPCKYYNCTHTHEPSCGVKKLLEAGKIDGFRYEFYLRTYDELKNKRS